MKINWTALLSVAVVTFVAALAVVGLMAFAAKLLDDCHVRQRDGQSCRLRFVCAYSLFGLVGLMILFGLWLIIPYLH